MGAAKVSMVIEQGATYSREITYTNSDGTAVDLTGYTAKMQIRSKHGDPSAIITLTSSPAAGLTITPLTGKVKIRIGADLTNLLTITNGVYDLELTSTVDPTEVIRLIEGQVTVTPQVTL